MSKDRVKAAGSFDRGMRNRNSVGQCVHPKRCSTDAARRAWYATYRTVRLARLSD